MLFTTVLCPNCKVRSLMRGLLPITPLSFYVWRANWQTIFSTSVNGCLPRLHSLSNTLGHIVSNPLSVVSKTGGSPPANQRTIQPALCPDIPELTGLAGCIATVIRTWIQSKWGCCEGFAGKAGQQDTLQLTNQQSTPRTPGWENVNDMAVFLMNFFLPSPSVRNINVPMFHLRKKYYMQLSLETTLTSSKDSATVA